MGRVHIGPVAVTGFHGVPCSRAVPEPTAPGNRVRAVLGVAGTVTGRDHAEAAVRDQAERVGVVVHEGHGRARW